MKKIILVAAACLLSPLTTQAMLKEKEKIENKADSANETSTPTETYVNQDESQYTNKDRTFDLSSLGSIGDGDDRLLDLQKDRDFFRGFVSDLEKEKAAFERARESDRRSAKEAERNHLELAKLKRALSDHHIDPKTWQLIVRRIEAARRDEFNQAQSVRQTPIDWENMPQEMGRARIMALARRTAEHWEKIGQEMVRARTMALVPEMIREQHKESEETDLVKPEEESNVNLLFLDEVHENPASPFPVASPFGCSETTSYKDSVTRRLLQAETHQPFHILFEEANPIQRSTQCENRCLVRDLPIRASTELPKTTCIESIETRKQRVKAEEQIKTTIIRSAK